MPSQFLTSAEVAKLLGVAEITVCKWRVSGYGPPFCAFGRAIRYAREDVEAWATQRRRRSTSDVTAAKPEEAA